MKNIKNYTDHLRESIETPKQLGQRLLRILSGNKDPDIEEVKDLIKAGADLETRYRYGKTPLHFAAKQGHTEAAKALMEAGAELEAKTSDDQTPLHYAALYGHTEIVKALIKAGAELEAKDRDGRTPLQYAATWGRTEAAKALIRAGADISAGFGSLDVLEEFFGGNIGWVPQESIPPEWRKRHRARGAFGRF